VNGLSCSICVALFASDGLALSPSVLCVLSGDSGLLDIVFMLSILSIGSMVLFPALVNGQLCSEGFSLCSLYSVLCTLLCTPCSTSGMIVAMHPDDCRKIRKNIDERTRSSSTQAEVGGQEVRKRVSLESPINVYGQLTLFPLVGHTSAPLLEEPVTEGNTRELKKTQPHHPKNPRFFVLYKRFCLNRFFIV
jgi:hypothetical protein